MLVSREPSVCNSREFSLFVLVVFLCAVSVVCDSEACVQYVVYLSVAVVPSF